MTTTRRDLSVDDEAETEEGQPRRTPKAKKNPTPKGMPEKTGEDRDDHTKRGYFRMPSGNVREEFGTLPKGTEFPK